MRLLHTADVHLRADRPETVDALDAVLAAADGRDVDLVTVGGDLFDRPADVDALRPTLRETFAGAEADVLVIPGNHDAAAFRRSLDFGPGVHALVADPCEVRTEGGVTVVGVPYTETFTEELYGALQDAAPADGPGVLLLHCTLDVGFGRADVGGEDATAYCPVRQATLGELGYDLVLGGHIHSRFDLRRLPGGGTFVYPGSPCSHTAAETGRRRAALVDVEAGRVEGVELPTFYRDRGEWTVRPGEAEAVVEDVGEWTDERAEDACELTVAVDGFVRMPEDEFAERLRAAAGDAEIVNETRDVRPVLDHELYQRFERRLRARDDVEDPAAVEDVVLASLGRLLSAGEVRS